MPADMGCLGRVGGERNGPTERLASFLGAFELPRAFYPAPADCNERCIVEVVGDKARDIAATDYLFVD